MSTAKREQKEKKPRKEPNKKAFAIATLRRASYRWPARNRARNAAKVGRNQYLCALCPKTRIYGRSDTQLDHLEPVIPLTGWVGFDSFIERLFAPDEGWQLLCKKHHDEKTEQEREFRKAHKKLQKLTKEKIQKRKKNAR